MFRFEKDEARLTKLMEEVLEDECEGEVRDDQSDRDESDHEDKSDHDTDTEQEVSDENEAECNESLPYFKGNDGSVWKKHPPARKTVRTRKENIIRLPGCTSATKSLKELSVIFNYFINDEIVQIIVDSTNSHIESIKSHYSRGRDALPTNSVEIRALFGLLYLAGITGSNKTNTADL
ncbi:uncharacterized protein [Onthophagus taurus]|uniref:uncharacterized protein isoform X1 n=1 Tax=Onthophagus taurus TaxID=166361 RepID=UPI0039BEC512